MAGLLWLFGSRACALPQTRDRRLDGWCNVEALAAQDTRRLVRMYRLKLRRLGDLEMRGHGRCHNLPDLWEAAYASRERMYRLKLWRVGTREGLSLPSFWFRDRAHMPM